MELIFQTVDGETSLLKGCESVCQSVVVHLCCIFTLTIYKYVITYILCMWYVLDMVCSLKISDAKKVVSTQDATITCDILLLDPLLLKIAVPFKSLMSSSVVGSKCLYHGELLCLLPSCNGTCGH